MSRTSHPVRPDEPVDAAAPAPAPAPVQAAVPAPERPDRRRRPQNTSWACIGSVDLLSRGFFAAVFLPLMIVLLLVAAVVGAVSLTYVAL